MILEGEAVGSGKMQLDSAASGKILPIEGRFDIRRHFLDLFDGRLHESSSCIDVVACVCCIGCFDGFRVGLVQRNDLAPRCSIESLSPA